MSAIDDFLAKLQSQHYGPNDSQIASSVMHPLEGLGKLGQYLQDSMQQVSSAPMQPYSNPQQATSSINASNSLAGLLQTSAFPFSPKSAGGTLGSMRQLYHGSPQPIDGAYNTPLFTTEDKGIAKLFSKSGATKTDKPVVSKLAVDTAKLFNGVKLGGEDAYRQLLAQGGIDVAAAIAQGPSVASSLVNTVYDPMVRDLLHAKGYTGLKIWDKLGDEEFISHILTHPSILKK